MKTVEARLISRSKDGKRAQVVVLETQVGGKKISVTRHVKREGGVWVGLNPDSRAIPANQEFGEAADARRYVLEMAREIFAKVEAVDPSNVELVKRAGGDATKAKEMRSAAIVRAAANVVAAEQEHQLAQQALKVCQEEYPLIVRFEF